MAQEIEYEQFEDAGAPLGLDGEVDLRRISGIPMELSVEIGRTQMTVGETLSLRAGSVVILDRFAGEPVDLLVNGTRIATGEVVVVDDKFGLRVSQVIEESELQRDELSQAGAQAGAEPAQGDPGDGAALAAEG